MSMASDTTARLLELPSLQTLVPDPSSQMPIPQTIVSINFFSSTSSSLLLPIFFLIPSLHTPMTSPAHLPRLPLPLCSPGQYSHHFLPPFWGSQKEWTHVQRWEEELKTGLICGKGKKAEEEDPGCAGLTINWSLWKLPWNNLTRNYQEMPGTFQTPSSLSPTGTTCQCIWHTHSHKTAEFLSLFKSNLQQPLSIWLPRKMRTVQSFCLPVPCPSNVSTGWPVSRKMFQSY